MVPTPIQKWYIPKSPHDFEIFIKRDDMTGSTLSGNKVRKLEFLLADALQQGCKSVITCGGVQSNHCRATATASRELGLDCHLFLRSGKVGKTTCAIFLDLRKVFDAVDHKILLRQLMYYGIGGKPAYCIPVGGSNVVGVFGYIEAWNELMSQNVCERVDDIVTACGSGGTVAGLAVGNYLTGQKVKIHAVSVSDDSTYFHNHVNEMLNALGLGQLRSEDLVDIIDGYKGAGYGRSTQEDHEFLHKISTSTGILCDPVYTGKAIKGMLAEMVENPSRFKGSRVMFLHTGGVYSLYDGTMQGKLQQAFRENAFVWKDEYSSPQRLYAER